MICDVLLGNITQRVDPSISYTVVVVVDHVGHDRRGVDMLDRNCWAECDLDEPKDDDLVLEGVGQKVVIDAVSLPFLADAVIDFTEELIGARFVINNPNASSSCGCGTSFSM